MTNNQDQTQSVNMGATPPESKKSLMAPIAFGAFVAIMIFAIMTFYTLINGQEQLIKNELANYDANKQRIEQQTAQLQAQFSSLTNTLSQEKARYLSLVSELNNVPRITRTSGTQGPAPTPALVTPTPTSAPTQQPVYTPPPRSTRAS